MNRLINIILLAALPGLMFCIVPAQGWPFRTSWHLSAVWIGGLCLTAFWSSRWRQLFWLIALARTATLLPTMSAYIQLLTIVVFLGAIEGYRRIRPGWVIGMLRLAGLALALWMLGQHTGLLPRWMGAGPFNPDDASVLLAMCLPALWDACELPRANSRRIGIAITGLVVWALIVAGATTGFLAAVAAALVYVWLRVKTRLPLVVAVLIVALAGLAWFLWIDGWDNLVRCRRWETWRLGLEAVWQHPWGRGLGSWRDLFPLLTAGNSRINFNGVMDYAHNEAVQALFELGWPMGLLVLAWLFRTVVRIVRRRGEAASLAGLTAMIVGSMGFFTFHVGPAALIACAWIALAEAATPPANPNVERRAGWRGLLKEAFNA